MFLCLSNFHFLILYIRHDCDQLSFTEIIILCFILSLFPYNGFFLFTSNTFFPYGKTLQKKIGLLSCNFMYFVSFCFVLEYLDGPLYLFKCQL